MAQNNWSFSDGYRAGGYPLEGLAVFHDTMANPLTVGGEYCRTFHTNSGNSTDNGFFARSNQASVTNIPDTKAISVRCWVRHTAWSNDNMAYISAKYNRTDWLCYHSGCGYHFGIKQGDFYLYTNGQNTLHTVDADPILGHSTLDRWVHLRMDVIPIKHNGVVIMDNIKCYTEVDEQWVLVKELYIESTDSNFVPWSGDRFVGFGHFNWNHWQHSWFDKFEVFTETVEQPDALFLNLTNDTGPSSQDLITADSSVTVSEAELGATRYYSLDNSTWSTSLPTFTSGSNTLFAKQVSPEGRTSPVSTLEFTYIPDDSFLTLNSGITASVVENSGESQVVYTANASNPYSSVSYSLKEVGDYLKFSINSSTGEVTLTEDPNFELSSSYDFTFKAQDLAGFTKERGVALSVVDQNEAPSFQASFSAGTLENPLSENTAQDSVVATLSATDPENDSVSFSLISQTNDGLFAVTGSSLILSGTLDYELSASHSVTLRASDGHHNIDQTYTIYVGDSNEAPSFSLTLVSGSQSTPLAEDTSAGFVLGTLSATDPEDDAVTFSILSQSPADVFEISGSDLKLSGALDYEANATHTLTIRATDGANNVDQGHTIYISDINEAPTFSLSLSSDPVPENTSVGTVVGTLTAADPENDDLIFSIVSQAPSGSFEISGSDLKVASALDYETYTSHSLTLRASDGTNDVDQNVTIDIGDVEEASAATDPDFSDVSLLLKMDGSNGSTTFTDDSSNSLTIAVNGNTQISTANSKYGGASAYFDGNGDYLEAPASSLTNLVDTDWTVECWFNAPAVSGIKGIFATRQGGGSWQPYYALEVTSGNVVNANRNFTRTAVGTYTPNQWHHIAMVRTSSDGLLKIYLDGTSIDSVSSNAPNIDLNFVIGLMSNWGGYYGYFSGYIDDFRVTKGVARYTADFTPPGSHPTS